MPPDVSSFSGARHKWNVLLGEMSAEVVAWLRADPVFKVGSPEFEALQLTFTVDSTGKDRRRHRVARARSARAATPPR